MKKFFLIVCFIVMLYLVVVAFLKLSGACPDYINMMPRAVVPSDVAKDIDQWWWYRFCPFSDKAY